MKSYVFVPSVDRFGVTPTQAMDAEEALRKIGQLFGTTFTLKPNGRPVGKLQERVGECARWTNATIAVFEAT